MRRTTAGAVVSRLVLTSTGLAFSPHISSPSSHREAPLTSADADIDNTDTYAFVSPNKLDTVVDNRCISQGYGRSTCRYPTSE